MSFDGSGNYTPAAAPNFPAVGGQTIVSGYYNNVINDIAAALSICITRDGQGKPTGPINWNGQNLTNVNQLSCTTLTVTNGLGIAAGGTGVTTVPANGKILIGNGAGYVLNNITGSGAVNVANGAGTITLSLTGTVIGSGLTCSTAVIIGRTSAGSGAPQEITIGTGLAMSAGVLSATGGGGGGNANLTMNNGGSGVVSGSTYNGGGAVTMSWNTIGAQPSSPRTSFSASGATYTPTGSIDIGGFTALAVAATIANATGLSASNDGFSFVVRVQDNGTARGISFGTNYNPVGVTLPTTTVSNKVLYIQCCWNNSTGKIDVVGVQQQ